MNGKDFGNSTYGTSVHNADVSIFQEGCDSDKVSTGENPKSLQPCLIWLSIQDAQFIFAVKYYYLGKKFGGIDINVIRFIICMI